MKLLSALLCLALGAGASADHPAIVHTKSGTLRGLVGKEGGRVFAGECCEFFVTGDHSATRRAAPWRARHVGGVLVVLQRRCAMWTWGGVRASSPTRAQ